MIQAFRVVGIPVRVDVGWLLVFGLISWSLAAGYFPRVVPDLTPGAAWLHGVAAAALLFASVLLHELSHALVATEHGVRVTGIRLHVFGGVSEMETEPATPGAELLIAAVGPLTSFAIAGACFGLGRVFPEPPWAAALTGYLAAVNLIVGLFNLVPGFPLDGGRIFRAVLWRVSGHLDWATRWASRSGTAFAVLLVGLGFFRSLNGEIVGGLWFVMIGLFLEQAARSSRELSRVRVRLEPLRVADVMTEPPAVLDASSPIARALNQPALAGGSDHVVEPGDSAWQAFLKIVRNGAGRVAVVEDGWVVGIVSAHDLHEAMTAADSRADLESRRAA